MAIEDLRTDAVETYLQRVHAQETVARYGALLLGPWEDDTGVLYRHMRVGTGLMAVVVRHDALSPEQRRDLGIFRLHQHLLCDWYDAEALLAREVETDPALATLSPGAMHILVGMPDGRMLAYCCLETASRRVADAAAGDAASARAMSLGDRGRPLFPSEVELVGAELFASMPVLRALPLARVREVACLLHNRAVQSPLATAAVVEAINLIAHLGLRRASDYDVVLGDINAEGRGMLDYCGLPVLYAPLAPVAPISRDFYWAETVNTPGVFWPFVIAMSDGYPYPAHFRGLDEMLTLPERELRRAMIQWRRRGARLAPERLSAGLETSPVFWTPDPYYGMIEAARPGIALAVGAETRK